MSAATSSILTLPSCLSGNRTNPLAPEFPRSDEDVLKHTVVPTPKEADPEWTKCPSLPSFPSLKTLPDPLTHPAYYATAVDVLRLTSWWFNQYGKYEYPLTKAHVQDVANKWREKHPSTTDYPFPPDLRTLLVKQDEKHPSDETGEPLWTRACEMFRNMSAFEKPGFQSMTRNQQMRASHEHDGTGLKQDEMSCMRYFVRYLVWREWIMNETGRSDVQPRRRELEALFAHPDVQREGITLADICHKFSMAKDIRMLVYRIEGLAEYHTKDDFRGDPVESVYMPKPAPTEEECFEEMRETTDTYGLLPLRILLVVMYPFGFGHEEIVAAAYDKLYPPAEKQPKPVPSPHATTPPAREKTPPPPPSPTEVGTPPPSPPPPNEKKRKRAIDDESSQPSKKTKTKPNSPPKPVSPPREGTPPPPPPSPPAAEKKRKRAIDDEPAPPLKKSKTESEPALTLVRCSGQTKAMKRCQLKRREPAGQTWLCSKHQ